MAKKTIEPYEVSFPLMYFPEYCYLLKHCPNGFTDCFVLRKYYPWEMLYDNYSIVDYLNGTLVILDKEIVKSALLTIFQFKAYETTLDTKLYFNIDHNYLEEKFSDDALVSKIKDFLEKKEVELKVDGEELSPAALLVGYACYEAIKKVNEITDDYRTTCSEVIIETEETIRNYLEILKKATKEEEQVAEEPSAGKSDNTLQDRSSKRVEPSKPKQESSSNNNNNK